MPGSSVVPVKNLRANPAVTSFVLDRTAATRYLEIRGDADIADDPGYGFAGEVGKKYRADLRAYDGENQNRVLVTIHPVRINAVDVAAGSDRG